MTRTTTGDVAAAEQLEPLGAVEVALVFGVPLFLALAAALTWWSVDRVEDRVETRVRDAATAAGVDPDDITIDVRYRDAAVAGFVADGIEPTAITAGAGGGLLRHIGTDGLVAAPPETGRGAGTDRGELATGPVRIDVVYDGMKLIVTGTVLNEGQHNVVLETLDLLTGRAEIDERLVISRLAPAVPGADARIADLVTAVESMDLAERWSLRLTDRGLSIEAVVADPAAAAAVGALDGVLTSTRTTIELTGPATVGEEA